MKLIITKETAEYEASSKVFGIITAFAQDWLSMNTEIERLNKELAGKRGKARDSLILTKDYPDGFTSIYIK